MDLRKTKGASKIAELNERKRQKKIVELSVQYYSALMILCLHDKFGFGLKRITRLLDEVQELSDAIDKGYISMKGVMEIVQNEIGVTLGGD